MAVASDETSSITIDVKLPIDVIFANERILSWRPNSIPYGIKNNTL